MSLQSRSRSARTCTRSSWVGTVPAICRNCSRAPSASACSATVLRRSVRSCSCSVPIRANSASKRSIVSTVGTQALSRVSSGPVHRGSCASARQASFSATASRLRPASRIRSRSPWSLACLSATSSGPVAVGGASLPSSAVASSSWPASSEIRALVCARSAASLVRSPARLAIAAFCAGSAEVARPPSARDRAAGPHSPHRGSAHRRLVLQPPLILTAGGATIPPAGHQRRPELAAGSPPRREGLCGPCDPRPAPPAGVRWHRLRQADPRRRPARRSDDQAWRWLPPCLPARPELHRGEPGPPDASSGTAPTASATSPSWASSCSEVRCRVKSGKASPSRSSRRFAACFSLSLSSTSASRVEASLRAVSCSRP